MTNLNTIIYNEDLTINTKTEQPIRAYAEQANTVKIFAPMSDFNTAFIIYQGLKDSVINPKLRATERLFMSPLDDSGVYNVWSNVIPGATLNDMTLMSCTGIRVAVEFWYIEGDCIGIEYYQVETGYAALLAASYPLAVSGNYVRVIDT